MYDRPVWVYVRRLKGRISDLSQLKVLPPKKTIQLNWSMTKQLESSFPIRKKVTDYLSNLSMTPIIT